MTNSNRPTYSRPTSPKIQGAGIHFWLEEIDWFQEKYKDIGHITRVDANNESGAVLSYG